MDADRLAKHLVREIWEENTLNGTIGTKNTGIARILEQTLAIISRELYGKETRFLLELIQNADDNTYSCEYPELNFTYKKGSLRVDCNEIGFTENDVRALCQIGRSTKTGLGRSTRYIGEKGIGFKSVFKVARMVYIHSRSFSFKLDPSQPVGIIAPVWAEFPEPTLPGYTSFYLLLAENCNEEELVQEVQGLDPTLLMFTRRLSQINLMVIRDDGPPWTQKLRREVLSQDALAVTVIHRGSTSQSYVIFKHLVSQLPLEERRPGCSESEILLAFPIAGSNMRPVSTTYPVYAFLPIRDYGFKFLLQADFLLTANREDILDIPWNRTLREVAGEAFLSAIQQFNSEPLRYTWPHYLPADDATGFFTALKIIVYRKLSKRPILESFAKTMELPQLLTYVPRDRFSDSNNIPFTLTSQTRSKYLSVKYPEWVIDSLCNLGVKVLDSEGFLQDLGDGISNEPTVFRRKGAKWHSKLAKVLLPLAMDNDNKARLQEMELIPLKDGRWVSMKQGKVYFHKGAPPEVTLEGLPLQTVHPAAEANPHRSTFLRYIGVEDFPDTSQICRLIIDTHETSTFEPYKLTCSQLVSHALFMYGTSFHPPSGTNLWLATTAGRCVKGSLAYMRRRPITKTTAEGRIITQLEKAFPFISEDYANQLPGERSWIEWLEKHLGVAVLPRVCDASSDSSHTYDLSDEFKYLFRTCDSADVLEILADNWREYIRQIMYLKPTRIVDSIASTLVTCRIGQTEATCKMPLRDTFLPMDGVVDKWAQIPRVAIRNPSDPKWSMLSYFGVRVVRDLQYYISSLQTMHGLKPPKTITNHIYYVMHTDYFEELENIRNAFSKQDMIYTSSGQSNSMRWASLRECVEKDYDIASEYPDSAGLFRALIKAGAAEFDILVEAACNCNERAKLSIRSSFLVKMSRALQSQGAKEAAEAIKSLRYYKPIFPIIRGWNDTEYDAMLPLQPSYPPWFVADRYDLHDSFRGVVDLLAIAPEDLESIDILLQSLDIKHRLLSEIVSCEEKPVGTPKLNKRFTVLMRKKAQFITALFPKSRPNRQIEMLQLKRVKVYIAPSILRKYQFTYGGKVFHGHETEGQVSFAVESGRLQIYMSRDSLATSVAPPELGSSIVDRYSIVNPSHRSLLLYVFYEDNYDRIVRAFSREGIHITGDSLEDLNGNYAALWSEEFLDTLSEPEDSDESEDELLSNFKHVPTKIGVNDPGSLDRRLPLQFFKWSERFLHRDIASDPSADYRAELQRAPVHSQYLGEVITSHMLQQHLGTYYDPEQHWTSPLRVKSGHSMFEHDLSTCASFTITGHQATRKTTDFLSNYGYSGARIWASGARNPTYHFDIAVSSGDSRSQFSWTSQQFERMRRFRLSKQQGWTRHNTPDDVHVLVRISDVFANPSFELFIDPWHLLISDRFTLPCDWNLTAAIVDEPRNDNIEPGIVSQQAAEATLLRPTQSYMPMPMSSNARSYKNQSPGEFSKEQYDPRAHVQSIFDPPTTVSQPVIANGSTQSLFNTQPTTCQQTPKLSRIILPYAKYGTASVYCYKSLARGDIRLFILHPGGDGDELRALVFQSSLLRSGSFQAVSYRWSSDALSHTLWTPDGEIKITSSLSAALHALRHRREPTVLWADAICINQRDLREKEEQIPLIPQIFQRATCVIVFLGNDNHDEAAIEALMQIRVNEALKHVGEEWPKDLPGIPAHWIGKSVPPAEDMIWSQINTLFARSWFQRAWIIQEVVVAMSVRVVCGRWMMDWNDLFSAIEIIEKAGHFKGGFSASSPPKWHRFLALAQLREREARHDRRPLLELLESFRYAESSKEHDRLFCHLGLAIDGNQRGFLLDYSISFDSLVRKYAWEFVEQGKALELFHRAGLGSRPTKLFPSWIPDWTNKKQPSLRTLASHGMPCDASWRKEPRLTYDSDNEFQVGVHGIRVDKIQIVSKTSNTVQELAAYLDEIDGTITRLPFESEPSLKWIIPIAAASRPRIAGTDMEDSYNALRKYLAAEAESTPSINTPGANKRRIVDEKGMEGTEALWSAGQNYLLAVQDECLVSWKFVVTERNRIGVAPPGVKKGDTVCILHGGVVPFLLRESKLADRAYELVGECYIDGLMKREEASLGEPEVSFRLR